jgi:hypothetical protein
MEVVRRRNEAADRRDAESTLSAYDPDVELDTSRLGVAGLAGVGRVYRGHDGLRSFFASGTRLGMRSSTAMGS